MNISVTRERIIEEIQENLSVVAGHYPMKELGETFEALATDFQGLAICNLLLSADVEGYVRNLAQSGFTRRYFLNRCRVEGNVADEHLAISRNESFFDLLAAGAEELAREIAALSPAEWIPDGEYEDDFAYYLFFHRYVASYPNTDRDMLQAIIRRFETALERDSSPRLKICSAFATVDQGLFEEGFEELIRERADRWAAEPEVEGPGSEPQRSVFVEGLALLALGERAGFVLENEYAWCPGVARRLPAASLSDDIFALMEVECPR